MTLSFVCVFYFPFFASASSFPWEGWRVWCWAGQWARYALQCRERPPRRVLPRGPAAGCGGGGGHGILEGRGGEEEEEEPRGDKFGLRKVA